MAKPRLVLIGVLVWFSACGGTREPPIAGPLPGVRVLRVATEEFLKLRGEWRGAEVGRILEWMFSFGDDWAVVVNNRSGDWYQGQAGIHYELGADRDGVTRVPPGSGVLDVDVRASRRGAHDGLVSLGVYYFTSPTELKLCASEPGVHIRALSYDISSPRVRCFRLKKVSNEPVPGRDVPVEQQPAPVERDDRR